MALSISSRLPAGIAPNAITRRLAELAAAGVAVVDLTESNPTCVGLPYPDDLLIPLAASGGLRYAPEPLGMDLAREAVTMDAARRGARIDASQVVLTASTSEAYSWLFKLFCDPGEQVLVPRPSYPLFEHLARLEGVGLGTYDLAYHGTWDIDLSGIAAAGSDVRALVVVSPNNPTGSCPSRSELAGLMALCRERNWVLIVDEVFVDYPLEATDWPHDAAASAPPCLTVSLGGLSKSVGLPQVKLGWMVVGGPPDARETALAALEIVADSFLSVSTPAQLALPWLLDRGAVVRQAIVKRIQTNMSVLRRLSTVFDLVDVPFTAGGWSAVLRVPATRTEDALVLGLLDEERILVHPGYFFDFRREAYLVVSLLVPTEVFEPAMTRVLAFAGR
jgi:hypothetical protein